MHCGASEKKIKVAVVGSGLAGLTIAYLLTRDPENRYEVEIFEAGPSPSLDAASMTVSLPDPTNKNKLITSRLDVPMRAFAGGFYKNLISLYTHLGIPYKPKNFLYTFSNGSSTTYHLHPSNLHRFPPKPEGLSWPAHLLQLVVLYVTYLYFTLCVFYVLPKTFPENESLKSYIRRIHLPDFITRNYLLPLFSAVSTCPHDLLLEFPASDIVDYRRSVYAQPHFVVKDGVSTVQERLLEGVTINCNRRVEAVEYGKDGLVVSWVNVNAASLEGSSLGESTRFDRVILAVNPAVVAKIYAPLRVQASRIPCHEVEVVLHTDGSVLANLFPPPLVSISEKPSLLGTPTHIRSAERLLAATDADLIHFSSSTPSKGRAAQTQASHLHSPGVLITTQPHNPIPTEYVLGGTTFTRVLRTGESRDIVRDLVANDGKHGVWVVGGWCWDGMVLLEGCVVSAARVAKEFGVEVPW